MANVLKNNVASEAIAKLYLNEKLADVHFSFNINDEIQTVAANKANLAVLSPVFNAMFFGTLKEPKDVEIVDASVGAFKEFLQFFYLDEVTLTMENIETVVRLADKYDVLEYVNACFAFLEQKLTLDNMCWGLQLALFLKNQTLTEFCGNRISESPQQVFASKTFLRCEKATLEHILNLNLTSGETDLFKACMEWSKYTCKRNGFDGNQADNLKMELGDCLKFINFGEMKLEEFTALTVAYDGFFTPNEFKDIVLLITMKGYDSKVFKQNPRQYIWNYKKVLLCQRRKQDGKNTGIQNTEVVSFTSNQPVLLGKFQSALTDFNGNLRSLTGSRINVGISQLEDSTFYSSDSPKIIFSRVFNIKFVGNRLIVDLPQPIYIKPKIIYEICVTVDAPNITSCMYSGLWEPKVELKNGLKICFHRNPFLSYDNSTYGWISTLELNRI